MWELLQSTQLVDVVNKFLFKILQKGMVILFAHPVLVFQLTVITVKMYVSICFISVSKLHSFQFHQG